MFEKISKTFKSDFIAALSVSVVAIPQSLAYASLAGLPPASGLIAATIPTILAAIIGTSSVLSTGPVAVISLLTASAISEIGAVSVSQSLVAASLLAVMVGFFQIGFSLLKFGGFINYITHPVMLGFTTAAAIVISVSQFPKLVNLDLAIGEHFYQNVFEIIPQLIYPNIYALFLNLLPLFLLFVLKKYFPRFPRVLFLVILGILAGYFLGYGGNLVGEVASTPLSFHFMDINSKDLLTLIKPALIIAIVAYMEGISVAKGLCRQTGDKINPNRELTAQGIANITSGVLGSFPVAGSFSRTALNFSSGSLTRFSSVYLGILTVLTVIFLSPVIKYLPQSILAAIVISAVVSLVKIDKIIELIIHKPLEGVTALVTLTAAFYFAPHLDMAIYIGVAASIIVHLYREAHPDLEIFLCNDRTYLNRHNYNFNEYSTNKYVLAVDIGASLNFTNSHQLYEKILSKLTKDKENIKYVILMCRGVNNIDDTAENTIEALKDELGNRGISLIMAGLRQNTLRKLERTALYDYVGKDQIFLKVNLALDHINHCLYVNE